MLSRIIYVSAAALILFYAAGENLVYSNTKTKTYYDRLQRINRVSIGTEVMNPVPGQNKYEYDGYAFYVRRIENRELEANETPEMMLSTCYAEALYYQGDYRAVELGRISAGGNILINQNRIFGTVAVLDESNNVRSCVNVTTPRLTWVIEGNSSFSGITFGNETMKFPNEYYIGSVTDGAVLGTDMDFGITAARVSPNSTVTVPPDMVRVWLLGPTGDPKTSLLNLQPCGRFEGPVNLEQCIAGVQKQYFKSVMEGAGIIPGEGCALVRSYKLYPTEIKNTVTNQMERWLFVMVVEAEVPVNFR